MSPAIMTVFSRNTNQSEPESGLCLAVWHDLESNKKKAENIRVNAITPGNT